MRMEVDARMLMARGIGRFVRQIRGRWVEDGCNVQVLQDTVRLFEYRLRL